MIEMRVREEYVPNRINFFERKVADTRPGIYKDIVVDEHCRCTRARPDAATATQYSNTHNAGVLLDFTLWDDSCSETLG